MVGAADLRRNSLWWFHALTLFHPIGFLFQLLLWPVLLLLFCAPFLKSNKESKAKSNDVT